MNENTLHLEIITPNKTIFTGDVKNFTAPGILGYFEILPKHAPFISTIQPGKVKFVTANGEEIIFAASGGVVEVHQGNVTFLAETMESKNEIDLQRAQAALDRAQGRLAAREPGTDIVRVADALSRARNRIKIATGS